MNIDKNQSVKNKSVKSKFKLTVIAMATSVALLGCNPTENAQTETTVNTNTATTSDTVTVATEANNQTVTIDTVNGDMEMQVNPNPIAVYDMTLMQDLVALGVEADGLPGSLRLDNLTIDGADKAENIGTVFEPDMEALNELQPQAILIGSRMAEKQDSLRQIAPTLDMTLDTANMYESSKQRLADLGKLFNKTDKAAELQQDIDDAIASAKVAGEGKGNALVILVNGNKLSVYGENSRFGFIHNEFGMPMADSNIEEARHGQPVSFEYLQQTDPDWLFVLDRTSAIGEEGEGAHVVLDNPLVHQTKAWKNDHIVYLSPDSYLAFGGYYQWLKDANHIAEALANAEAVQ